MINTSVYRALILENAIKVAKRFGYNLSLEFIDSNNVVCCSMAFKFKNKEEELLATLKYGDFYTTFYDALTDELVNYKPNISYCKYFDHRNMITFF